MPWPAPSRSTRPSESRLGPDPRPLDRTRGMIGAELQRAVDGLGRREALGDHGGRLSLDRALDPLDDLVGVGARRWSWWPPERIRDLAAAGGGNGVPVEADAAFPTQSIDL